MKGQTPIIPQKMGEDVSILWRVVAQLVKERNRQWLVKLPSGATVSATFDASGENVILDLSKLGAEVTGILNGEPAAGIGDG